MVGSNRTAECTPSCRLMQGYPDDVVINTDRSSIETDLMDSEWHAMAYLHVEVQIPCIMHVSLSLIRLCRHAPFLLG